MGYEFDFLAVGENSKGGDAIALRFGDLHGSRSDQFVMVVDGGYAANGDELVEHIKKYYKTNTVDLVLCTHPDLDHVSGLKNVVEKLEVKELAMHRPWNHSEKILKYVEDGRATANSVATRLQNALAQAQDLETIATDNNPKIKIWEPFQGKKITFQDAYEITVLGPSKKYYHELLACYLEEKAKEHKPGKFEGAMEGLTKIIEEKLHIETLTDPADDATSPVNNSSVILHCSFNDKHHLLTGDAGCPALTSAIDYADEKNITYYQPSLIQIPHHGSKRNIGPTVLNRILGPKGQTEERTCYASVPKEGDPKHPSKKVLNAFGRRGYSRRITAGKGKQHSFNAPTREGWSASEPLPFFYEIEED